MSTTLFPLVPLFAQAIMYGLYVGTSACCLRWLLFDDKDWNIRKKINWTMLTIAIVLFILMTVRVCIALESVVRSHYASPFEPFWLDPIEVCMFRDRTCDLRFDQRSPSSFLQSISATAIRLIFDLVLVCLAW